MNALTTKALGLALVIAVWAAISHLAKLPLELGPVIIGLACFIGAGGGMMGLQKSVAGTASGVVWAMLYMAVAAALDKGVPGVLDALVLGAVVFGMVFQARVPLLGYTTGAIVGAAVAIAVPGRTMTMDAGIRIAVALAIGCVLGIIAERLGSAIARMRVVPAMSSR